MNWHSSIGAPLTSRARSLRKSLPDESSDGSPAGVEYGARALGARSVLADPRYPQMRARVNQLLKKRDWFMPYAPSILEEHGSAYFEDFRPGQDMHLAFGPGRKPATRYQPRFTWMEHAAHTRSTPSRIRLPHTDSGVLFPDRRAHGAQHEFQSTRPANGRYATQAVHLPMEGCIECTGVEGYIVAAPRPRARSTVVSDDELLASMRSSPRPGTRGDLRGGSPVAHAERRLPLRRPTQ